MQTPGLDIPAIYADRFDRTGTKKRDRVWRVLCGSFFDAVVGREQDVLDVACGYGEFINNVVAKRRYAIDLNPDCPARLRPDIVFRLCSAEAIDLPDASIDIAFTSNFLEHLPDKAACNRVFIEIKRLLRPGGRFIVMGPNIRFAYREYWDWFDHFLPLSDRSLCEGLRQVGFTIERCVPRFLPVTMEGRMPTPNWLIRIYLMNPWAWRFFGKQFLIIARRA